MVKPSVSIIQEYCSKKKIEPPVYDYMQSEEAGFLCQVELLNHSIIGNGRSKRDAKHQAATNLIKALRATNLDIDFDEDDTDKDVEVSDADLITTTDMIMTLRDHCVKNNHPLPTFEIVQQAGTPNAPEFTAACKLASLRRYATSENKKDAKQKAAHKMFGILTKCSASNQKETAILAKVVTPEEEERRFRKFKTYFELTEAGLTQTDHCVPISERHNFYTKFHSDLKSKALAIIDQPLKDSPYSTEKEKAFAVIDALLLKPKIENAPTKDVPMLMITFDVDFDTIFVEREEVIWADIISYFNIMLR